MEATLNAERWVIIKLNDKEDNHKVLVQLDSRDVWRINSGITKVAQDSEYYYFIGFSGSCYKCHKDKYGITSRYVLDILNNIKKLTPATELNKKELSDYLSNNLK